MKKLLFSMLFLFSSALVFAQGSGEKIGYFLPKGNFTYDSKIPTPAQFLGYDIGDQHVTTSEIYRYMEHLASHSNRFKWEYVGKTYENRPLMYVSVTSADNQNNISSILEQRKKLTDPLYKGDIDYKNLPIVIWLGYSIHGNEGSGINGSLAVAYFLAAAQGEEMDNILKNSVIVMHPVINPDGSDRFAMWVNSNRSFTPVTDPSSREFNEPWPGSRSNHYWFDLNRDILYIQHPESRSKVEAYRKWMPNIVNDHHEQGSNSHFFFMPGVESRTNPMTHKDNWSLTKKVGAFHAAELDKIGTMYFTEDGFDDFYYGKGSTYPDIHGAIGMLFEQGSSRGHIRSTENGILTLAMGSRNQAYTSYSTIRAAMSMKNDLLKHQRDSYVSGYNENRSRGFDGYVIGGNSSRGVNKMVLDILLNQGIDIYKLKSSIEGDGMAFNKDNSYFVPVAQKESRKVNAIFDNVTQFLDSAFYDISAWTLTEAANLNTIKVKGSHQGDKLLVSAMPKGSVIGGESALGYFMRTNEYFAHKAIHALQSEGLRVKVATSPFKYAIDGKTESFDNGTILIQVPDQSLNQFNIHTLVSKLASQYSVDFYAVSGGTGENAQLGGANFSMLRMPKVAMLIGSGASSLDAGEIWFLFDQRMEIPLTLLDNSRISKNTLAPYNTLIITGRSDLSTQQQQALVEWTNDGGTLITVSGGWNLTNTLGLTKLTTRQNIYSDNKGSKPREYSLRREEGVGRSVGGVIFKTRIDLSHPICYGYSNKNLSVFHKGTQFFNNITDPFSTPVRYVSDPVVSGYVSADNIKNIASTPSVLVGSAGRGRVIVFNSSPTFRAFWFGTQKMFYNAIFFAPNISASKLESLAPVKHHETVAVAKPTVALNAKIVKK